MAVTAFSASSARLGQWAAFTILAPRRFHVSTSLIILVVAIVLGLFMRFRRRL